MQISETQLAAVLGVATLCFLGGFWLLPGGVLSLRRRAGGEIQVDIRPGYRLTTLYRVLGLYGAEGIRSFRRMLWADMIFPAVYGALIFVLGDLISSTHTGAHRATDLVKIIGIAAAAFDYCENILLLLVIRQLPRQRPITAQLAGISTSLKTASLFAAVVSLAGALAMR